MKSIYFLIILMIYSFAGAGQEALTLDSCRNLALLNNPTLKQLEKRVESAEANIKSKRKDYFPTIDAGGDYTFLQHPIRVELNENTFEGAQNLYSINAPIVQNVYSGSIVRRSNEMAELQKELTSSNRDDAENILLLQTELGFWQAIYNQELVKLAGKNKDAIDELVKVVSDRVESEIISKNDLLLLEVRQNEAELFSQVTSDALEVSLLELNSVMGIPSDQEITLEGDLNEVLFSEIDYSLDSVLHYRPDIMAQSKKIDIQKTNAALVKSQYLPKVYVGVIPAWGAPNTVIGTTQPNYNTSFTAGVNVPITRWGKRSQDVEKELLLADAATFELQELRDKVSLEVNSSDYQLKEAAKRIELTTSSLEKADENLKIMTDRYQDELTSILEVLDAQLYWQRSYKNMLDAQLYYKRALAYHKNAIGIIK